MGLEQCLSKLNKTESIRLSCFKRVIVSTFNKAYNHLEICRLYERCIKQTHQRDPEMSFFISTSCLAASVYFQASLLN